MSNLLKAGDSEPEQPLRKDGWSSNLAEAPALGGDGPWESS